MCSQRQCSKNWPGSSQLQCQALGEVPPSTWQGPKQPQLTEEGNPSVLLVDTGASVSSKAQAACTHLPNIRSLFCWDSPCDAL